jgi:hypothetical protein
MEIEYTLYEGFFLSFFVLAIILIYLRLERIEKWVKQELAVPKSAEYIICAAIWYDHLLGAEYDHQPTNVYSGFVICGHRHHNCISIRSLIGPDRDHVQGFLTNENRFVNRSIALAANQIKPESLVDAELKRKLYSEHLY